MQFFGLLFASKFRFYILYNFSALSAVFDAAIDALWFFVINYCETPVFIHFKYCQECQFCASLHCKYSDALLLVLISSYFFCFFVSTFYPYFFLYCCVCLNVVRCVLAPFLPVYYCKLLGVIRCTSYFVKYNNFQSNLKFNFCLLSQQRLSVNQIYHATHLLFI